MCILAVILRKQAAIADPLTMEEINMNPNLELSMNDDVDACDS